ncbi:Ger(x)C family spore germination protein [Paenibacillus sp. 2TAB23]|uniref:Ger(x)C family spore germination protein n=1 Tax=Paenibacillus sp. 2TAB23 TaxID=3233004 RepID=UPI003F99E831
MKIVGKLSVLFILLLTTGCWNLREPDRLAFNLGEGWDYEEGGRILLTAQIAIPASAGGQQIGGGEKNNKGFRTMTANGVNIYDRLNNMQRELPREIFFGHREIILIGQKMAEHGIGNLLDEIVRNPRSELRSKVFIVKDGVAKDILSSSPIFDPFTQTSLTRQEEILHLKHTYFRSLLADSLSQGIQPIVPAISLSPSSMPVYVGSAVLNKNNGLKLVAFLDNQESAYANWIKDRQDSFVYTSYIEQQNQNISVIFKFLHSRIKARMTGDKIRIHIELTGKGSIVENNTNLDPTKTADLRIIEEKLEMKLKHEIQELIVQAQTKYHIDIFGFGEKVHHQLPKQWKIHQDQWDRTFSGLQISVGLNVKCDDPGQTNKSIKF